MLLDEAADRLMLEFQRRLDLDVRKIQRRGDLPDALTHCLLTPGCARGARHNPRRCRFAWSDAPPAMLRHPRWLDRSSRLVSVSDAAGLERRPFSRDGARVWRWHEKLRHERFTPLH